jgi:hypothetical protein
MQCCYIYKLLWQSFLWVFCVNASTYFLHSQERDFSHPLQYLSMEQMTALEHIQFSRLDPKTEEAPCPEERAGRHAMRLAAEAYAMVQASGEGPTLAQRVGLLSDFDYFPQQTTLDWMLIWQEEAAVEAFALLSKLGIAPFQDGSVNHDCDWQAGLELIPKEYAVFIPLTERFQHLVGWENREYWTLMHLSNDDREFLEAFDFGQAEYLSPSLLREYHNCGQNRWKAIYYSYRFALLWRDFAAGQELPSLEWEKSADGSMIVDKVGFPKLKQIPRCISPSVIALKRAGERVPFEQARPSLHHLKKQRNQGVGLDAVTSTADADGLLQPLDTEPRLPIDYLSSTNFPTIVLLDDVLRREEKEPLVGSEFDWRLEAGSHAIRTAEKTYNAMKRNGDANGFCEKLELLSDSDFNPWIHEPFYFYELSMRTRVIDAFRRLRAKGIAPFNDGEVALEIVSQPGIRYELIPEPMRFFIPLAEHFGEPFDLRSARLRLGQLSAEDVQVLKDFDYELAELSIVAVMERELINGNRRWTRIIDAYRFWLFWRAVKTNTILLPQAGHDWAAEENDTVPSSLPGLREFDILREKVRKRVDQNAIFLNFYGVQIRSTEMFAILY